MESYLDALARINSIRNKIANTFPSPPNSSSRSGHSSRSSKLSSFPAKEAVPVPNESSRLENNFQKVLNDETISKTKKVVSKNNSNPPKGIYDVIIDEASKKHELPSALLKSIVKVESNFNPLAVSHKGAQGLMQIMPRTAEELNLANPFQPAENVDSGAKYFKNLFNKFNGDLVKALAAYNAGENSIRDGKIPNYKETKNYIKKVMEQYLKYNGVDLK